MSVLPHHLPATSPPGADDAGPTMLEVTRAWPKGAETLRVEGHDPQGRLRAGEVRVEDGRPGRARLTPFASDPRLPGLAAAASSGRIVVHRHGRRAVVARADRYVKVVRPGRGAGVAAQARTGHRLATAAGFDAPEVLRATDDRVEMSVVPGRSMHDLGRAPGAPQLGPWEAAWRAWRDRWPALVTARPDGADDRLSTHAAADEAAVLDTWAGHVLTHRAWPGDEDLLRERVDGVRRRLAESPGPLVVAHRDLHDKQVLVDGSGTVGLLDFDTASRAEAALDLANLAVHACLRELQGLWSTEQRAIVVAQVGGVAEALDVPARRLAAYAEATWLRLACLYAFRPAWSGLATHLLREPVPSHLGR